VRVHGEEIEEGDRLSPPVREKKEPSFFHYGRFGTRGVLKKPKGARDEAEPIVSSTEHKRTQKPGLGSHTGPRSGSGE